MIIQDSNLDSPNLITRVPNVWTKDMNSLFEDIKIILDDSNRWQSLTIPRESVGAFTMIDKLKRRTEDGRSKKDDYGIYVIKRFKISTKEWIYWYIGETGVSFYSRNYRFVRTLRKNLTEKDTPHPAAVAIEAYRDDLDWCNGYWVDLDSENMLLPNFEFCFIKFNELDFDLVDRKITHTQIDGKIEHDKTDEDLRIEFESKLINEFKPIANQRQRDEIYRYRDHVVYNDILVKFGAKCVN